MRACGRRVERTAAYVVAFGGGGREPPPRGSTRRRECSMPQMIKSLVPALVALRAGQEARSTPRRLAQGTPGAASSDGQRTAPSRHCDSVEHRQEWSCLVLGTRASLPRLTTGSVQVSSKTGQLQPDTSAPPGRKRASGRPVLLWNASIYLAPVGRLGWRQAWSRSRPSARYRSPTTSTSTGRSVALPRQAPVAGVGPATTRVGSSCARRLPLGGKDRRPFGVFG
jgi:hypothetical protein